MRVPVGAAMGLNQAIMSFRSGGRTVLMSGRTRVWIEK